MVSSFLRRASRAVWGRVGDRPRAADVPDEGKILRHVVVVGGTRCEWAGRDEDEWRQHVEQLGAALCSHRVPWLTLRPYDEGGEQVELEGWEQEVESDGRRCTAIVDPTADGRQRFAEAMRRLPPDRAVTEETVTSVLYAPAEAEPDLVLVLGPDDRLPPSLVWELAYAELVFSNLTWGELDADALHRAVAEFTTRHRRFGGLDAETG